MSEKNKQTYFRGQRGNSYMHKTYPVLGWQNPQQKSLYNELVKKLSNGVIVEIGVYGGASLLSIVENCQKTNTQIFGIDPWEKLNVSRRMNGNAQWIPVDDCDHEQLKSVRLNLENIIQNENYENNVTLIHDFSYKAYTQFQEETVDVLYIDGCHDYDAVITDLRLWFSKVKNGGVILGDDFLWKGVSDAVKDFCKENKIQFDGPAQLSCGNLWRIIK